MTTPPPNMTATEIRERLRVEMEKQNKLLPDLWSKELLTQYAKTLGLENALKERPRPEADPLSKAIIVEGLTELSAKYPNRHLTGILLDIVKMNGDETDYEMAEKITLACCSESEGKTDSPSEKSPAGSTVRIRHHSIKP